MTGTGAIRHWCAQRISALALIALMLWLIEAIFAHLGEDRAQIRTWLGQPVPAVVAAALVALAFFHLALGVRVVLEDYVQTPARLAAALAANRIACWALALIALAAIVTLAFGL
ncbi:MAG: succinate dehydrogenase, hydrophobic membrane anchor protein [Alphaproteobacteria bacterium]|nr:succinate dehydrogenase, hydrophobic membrane anchor protein [Alphaproteobacteria bacterium]